MYIIFFCNTWAWLELNSTLLLIKEFNSTEFHVLGQRWPWMIIDISCKCLCIVYLIVYNRYVNFDYIWVRNIHSTWVLILKLFIFSRQDDRLQFFKNISLMRCVPKVLNAKFHFTTCIIQWLKCRKFPPQSPISLTHSCIT